MGMPNGDANVFDDDFLVRLEHVRLQMRKRFAGTLRAERRSRRMGSSLEFADFRNYVPGDDPRRIDWSIYGRIERLMMKLYEEEEELDVAILIDCSASMHWRASGASHAAKFVARAAPGGGAGLFRASRPRPRGAVVLRFSTARRERAIPRHSGIS